MVIQRWQSLLLLISTILLAVASFFPFVVTDSATLSTSLNITILILLCLSALLSFTSIFLFKNFRRQKLAIRLAIFFAATLLIISAVYFFINSADNACYGATSNILTLCALAAQAIALNRVKADERLLRSADRFR